jgi:hypothetical protein
MSRFNRLTSLSLSSYAAYLLLAACSDGGAGNDNSPDPGGNTAGTAVTPVGGGLNSAGTSSGVPNSPVAGQATGGAPGVGAGGTAAGGGAKGGAATSGAGGVATSGAGGVATNGGAGSGAGGTLGVAGTGGKGGNAGSGGSSNPPACTNAAEILCSGACVDPKTSEQHCGGCGKVCANGQQCDNSSCKCTGDLDLCNNACVNTDTDEQNCGACGTKCGADQTCESGKCTGGTVSGSCSSITDFGVVSATIVVKNGETYDGKCRRYRADADKLGDGSQKEGQKPVFEIEGGGKLINVVLGAPAADGIHTKGNVTLENITWEDIGEDAMTIKESGTVILNGGSAKNGDDKVFQINAVSTFRVSNFKASNAGKFIRQNGGSTFKAQVFIDKCDISNMDEAIFRTDSSSSTVSMTNTRYHAIGDSNFIGVASGNITQSNNTAY